VFAYPDGWNYQRQTGGTDIERMPVERRKAPGAVGTDPRIGQAKPKAQAHAHAFTSAPIADEMA